MQDGAHRKGAVHARMSLKIRLHSSLEQKLHKVWKLQGNVVTFSRIFSVETLQKVKLAT